MDETPKHKPSEKHALDDVLKSLQDMVRSELLPPDPSKAVKKPPPDPDVPRKRGRPRKELPPESETAPATPACGPVSDYDAILSSLEELVARDLNIEEPVPGQAPDAGEQTAEAEIPTLMPLSLAPPSSAPSPAPDNREDSAKAARPGKPAPRARQTAVEPQAPAVRDRDQHEFAFDPPSPATQPLPPDPPASPGRTRPPEVAAPSPKAGKTAVAEAASIPGPSATPAESDLTETPAAAGRQVDDIPVLEDIAARPPRAFADFSPGEVREAAIRVIARLNIELRRTGQPPLDARLIDRLQSLLGEELGRKSEK